MRQNERQQAVTNNYSSLGHSPGVHWEFDEAVSQIFEDMLARSIPQLDCMREVVFRVASRFIKPQTDIVDLGCAHGDSIARLLLECGGTNRFVGVDVALPMLEACRRRFQSEIQDGVLDLRNTDLRVGYPEVRASLTLCVLTLQFIPLEHRYHVLKDIFQHTVPGGAFLLVEKVLGADFRLDELLVNLYHEHKRKMGYSEGDIDRKRLSLEGVLVPLTTAWTEQLLNAAGFRHVECIWRCLNFCAWVAIRE